MSTSGRLPTDDDGDLASRSDLNDHVHLQFQSHALAIIYAYLNNINNNVINGYFDVCIVLITSSFINV